MHFHAATSDCCDGGSGGTGQPSAISFVLLVELLTDEISGSRMKRVKAQIARNNAVFFMGVALLA